MLLTLHKRKSLGCRDYFGRGAALLVAMFFWCLGWVFAASVPTLTVTSEVIVVGEKVSLGMLLVSPDETAGLTEALNETIVTESPKAGNSKILEAAEVYRRLKAVGIRKEEYQIQVPEFIKIRRKSQMLRIPDIESKVREEFLPTLQWEEVQLERIDIPESVQLPLGQIKLTFEYSPHTDFTRPFYLNVGFTVDGRPVTQAFYRTELAISQTVPLAARALDSLARVSAADIRWEKQRLSSTLRVPVKDLSFFEHKRAKQKIPSGKLLTEDLFAPVPMINRGDRVTLLFEQAKLRITVPGKSLAPGSKGERIRVINLDSKKELLAEVLDERTVRVGL
jgi:flagellar basal body P-ring formation protein FlgA